MSKKNDRFLSYLEYIAKNASDFDIHHVVGYSANNLFKQGKIDAPHILFYQENNAICMVECSNKEVETRKVNLKSKNKLKESIRWFESNSNYNFSDISSKMVGYTRDNTIQLPRKSNKEAAHARALIEIAQNPSRHGIRGVKGYSIEMKLIEGKKVLAEPDILFYLEGKRICIVEYKGDKNGILRASEQISTASSWFGRHTNFELRNISSKIISGSSSKK